MPVEQREQVTRVEINRVNWQQEEPAGFGGRRQPLSGGTSRVNREVYARFCERLGVKLPGPTRRVGRGLAAALSPTLPEFAKRYGVHLPEARAIASRFREIYCVPEDRVEAAALVRRLACIFERSRG